LPEKVKGHGAANQGDDEDDEEDMRWSKIWYGDMLIEISRISTN
jgi:hypothetical protein